MSVVEMSFDLSDTAAAYCDASVGAQNCGEVVLCCMLSGSGGQTQIRSACPSAQFADTKEVRPPPTPRSKGNGDERG